MIALIRDYLRRSWLLGLLASGAVFGFLVIACRVFLQIQQRGGASPLTKLIPKWVQTAFDIGPASMTELNGYLAVIFQHPFVLTVLLALPVALLTGFFTGDIEKRSISLVLARPVSRFGVVAAIAIVVLAFCALGVASLWAGCYFGAMWSGQSESLNAGAAVQAALGLAMLVFAFTGIFAALSAFLSVRGDAVGWCLTVVLTMYVWNFLAQIWYAGGGMANYSLFRFYQPTETLLKGVAPSVENLGVLALVGAAGWVVCALCYRFRSFTV